MNRRQFLKDASTTVGAAWFASSGFAPSLLHAFDTVPSISHVAFVKTTDRATGVKRAIDLLGMGKFGGKDLFIKPNF
ncbi:MAG TPA: twin-arginine translocation signal domain-containing protein, partial [Candidatus Angelobacter sp.]|nr:twin-arginine translocation signal domain-containing protein [Candidatus Angelobacter sp.]